MTFSEPEKVSQRRRAVYVISIAAELAGVHPQTLRLYERKGLLNPSRTSGNSRRYSEADLQWVRKIQELTQQAGVNLAGVRMIMELEDRLDTLREQLDRARERAEEAKTAAETQSWGALVRLRDVRNPFRRTSS